MRTLALFALILCGCGTSRLDVMEERVDGLEKRLHHTETVLVLEVTGQIDRERVREYILKRAQEQEQR